MNGRDMSQDRVPAVGPGNSRTRYLILCLLMACWVISAAGCGGGGLTQAEMRRYASAVKGLPKGLWRAKAELRLEQVKREYGQAALADVRSRPTG